jgi:hypothetical protein
MAGRMVVIVVSTSMIMAMMSTRMVNVMVAASGRHIRWIRLHFLELFIAYFDYAVDFLFTRVGHNCWTFPYLLTIRPTAGECS